MAQGTIKDYDEETRTGSLLMEDRTEVAIDATSIEGRTSARCGSASGSGSTSPSRRRADRAYAALVTFD